MTPLHCASRLEHIDVVRLLLDKGANTEAQSQVSERGRNVCVVILHVHACL